MNLSLRQIRYFIAVSELGKISSAAMELHVSQSAITTSIKGLEDLLGCQLFERQPSGVTLTYEGNQFLQHAKHIMASVDEAIRLPSRENAAIKGAVRLAVSSTVAGYFLPAYLSRFCRSFPNIEVDLVEANREEIEEGIISRGYDLAMMLTSNLVNQEDISIETLIHSRRRLWLDANHPLINKSSVSLQDVSELPYIMLTMDEASNTALRYWNQTPYRPNVIFRTTAVEAVRSMVANGMGVTVLSDMVYRPWSLEGLRLEVRTLTDAIPDMDVGLAWEHNLERPKPVNAFCEFMRLATGSSHPILSYN